MSAAERAVLEAALAYHAAKRSANDRDSARDDVAWTGARLRLAALAYGDEVGGQRADVGRGTALS